MHNVPMDTGESSSVHDEEAHVIETVESLRARVRTIGDVAVAWASGGRIDPRNQAAEVNPELLFHALRTILDRDDLAMLERAARSDDLGGLLRSIAHAAHEVVDAMNTIAVADAWYGESTEQLADLMESVGWLAAATGRYQDADPMLYQAAHRLSVSGRVPESARLCEVMVEYLRRFQPGNRAQLANVLVLWNHQLDDLGQIDEGIARLHEAAQLATNPIQAATIDSELGKELAKIGEFDASLRMLARALGVLENDLGNPYVHDTLQSLAHTYAMMGMTRDAVACAERAWSGLEHASPILRYSNARFRASLHQRLGNYDEAADAFVACFGSARSDVVNRLPQERVAKGVLAEMTIVASLSHELAQRQEEVYAALERHRRDRVAPGELINAYERLIEAARADRNHWLELTGRIGLVDVLTLTGGEEPEVLRGQLWSLRTEAIRSMFTVPIGLADVSLLNLIDRGVDDVAGPGDVVLLATEAILLSDLASSVAKSYEGPARGPSLRMPHIGGALIGLACEAATHGARELGIRLFRRAIDDAQGGAIMGIALSPNRSRELRYRVAMPDALRDGAGSTEDIEGMASDVQYMLDNREIDDASELVARRVLGSLRMVSHPRTALRHLRRAADLLEELRAGVRERNPAGSAAADRAVDTEHPVYRSMVGAMIAAKEPPATTFAALQHFRARDLLRRLASVRGVGTVVPPDAVQARALVSALPTPTALVDITWAPWGLRAFIVDPHRKVRIVDATGDTSTLRDAPFGDVRRRAAELIAFTQSSPLLHELVEAIEGTIDAGYRLLVSVDDAMVNVPLHAVPFRGQPWAETRSIGRIPAIGALAFGTTDLSAGPAVVAGDSRGDLPYAAAECERVAASLSTTPLVGATCTLDAVRLALQNGAHGIVHFAVHGRGDVRRGGRSALLFADGNNGTVWSSFDELASAARWRAGLIVFSGCSTAVGGPRQGQGMYGLAHAAAAAGAGAVIGSLWPVDDRSTEIYMTAFYRELERARSRASWVDLRDVMDHARVRLQSRLSLAHPGLRSPLVRDGRHDRWDDDRAATPPAAVERDMLHWGPFVLIGQPIATFGDPIGSRDTLLM